MKRTFPKLLGATRRGKATLAEPQTFGYARVSTSEQRLDMQLDALGRAGVPVDNVYVEKVSGQSRRRPAFENLMRALRPGDTIVVLKIDRFGRKALPILERLAWFKENNITFKSLSENIDFGTPMGEAMVAILAAMAQYEVRTTGERTKRGIAAHRERGGRYGRKVEFDLQSATKHLKKHGDVGAAAKYVGVDRQRLWYHVQRDPALLRLVKPKKK